MSSQLGALFSNAEAQGFLDDEGSSVLINNQDAIMIAGAKGIDSENLEESAYTTVTLIIDKSSSIGFWDLEQAIRDGVNEMVDALQGSKEKDEILLSIWAFDSSQHIIHSFVGLDDAVKLDNSNYRSGGTTALYDTYIKAVGANLAYAQNLRDAEGASVRSVVIVFTDGYDVGSQNSAGDCLKAGRKALATETLIVGFVGVGEECEFRPIGQSMGIPDNCILEQKSTSGSEIRKVFQVLSESIIRSSQGVVSPGNNAGFFAN